MRWVGIKPYPKPTHTARAWDKALTVSSEFALMHVLEGESVGENGEDGWFEAGLTVGGTSAGILLAIFGIIVLYPAPAPLNLLVGILMIFFGACVVV